MANRHDWGMRIAQVVQSGNWLSSFSRNLPEVSFFTEQRTVSVLVWTPVILGCKRN